MIEEVREHSLAHPGSHLVIDTESTGLGTFTGDVCRGVTATFHYPDRPGVTGWYLPVSHPCSSNLDPRVVGALVTELINRHPSVAYHHWKHDQPVLEQIGVPYHLPTWDTLPGAWLEAEPLTKKLKQRHELIFGRGGADAQRALRALQKGRSLKSLEDEHYYGPEGPQSLRKRPMGITRAEARALALEDERKLPKSWATFTYEDVREYATEDGALTADLECHQRELASNNRPDIAVALPREIRWQATLLEMEQVGIRVDRDKARVARARALARMAKIRDAFLDRAGIDLGRNATCPELRELVYERWRHPVRFHTDGGRSGEPKPSTCKEALEALAYDPRVGLILEYRRLFRAMSGYYDPLLNFADEQGRVHPSYGLTKNGRPSASNPNVLTIPRDTDDNARAVLREVRDIFIPEDGMELWEYDLGQAEPRCTAAMCRDESMMGALNDPERDLYQEVATATYCQSMACVRDKRGRCAIHRPQFKTVVLANQYGQGVDSLAVRLAVEQARITGRYVRPDPGRARTLSVGLERAWPRLGPWKSHIEQVAREDGKIRLPAPGRYRHFRGPGFTEPYKDAANAAAQGSVAELAKTVQMAVTPDLHSLGARCVLHVYDSWVTEQPTGLGERVGRLLQRAVDDCNPYPWVRHVVEAKRWN